jgi:two-component system LytT family response regulator
MKLIRAVVIDDEFYNRDLIMKLVLKISENFEIIGIAENIEEGFELINLLKPDVVFLDIKMPGGSGFDLLRKFENPDFEIVFITGFDEYAIKAFDFNALDYILKPIDTSKLKSTLNKVSARVYNKQLLSGNIKQALQSYNTNNIISKIPVHFQDKVYLLDIDQIISIQTEDGYTSFKACSHANKLISSKQLSDFAFIIDDYLNFLKLSKSVYINLNYLKSYSKGRTCEIMLSDGSIFEVSRRKKTEILGVLDRKMAN